MTRVPALLLIAGLFAAVPAFAQGPAKDQTQLPPSNEAGDPAKPMVPPPGQPEPGQANPSEDLTKPPGDTADETQPEDISPDELSYGEIPDITVIELTADIARRSLDALAVVRDKYKDSNLENYENWQDFVDQTEDGKRFEADIKAAGFTTVNDWNVAIITVGFAYSAITDDLAGELTTQIEEIEKDTSLAQDLKDRMITGLKAMIPSDNNKKVVQAMIEDPAYTEKLKLLAEEGE